jgi:SPP1 gp7 family putative phage head morphogenesis protein
MPPLVIEAMQQFKAQLLARESAQMQEMARQWLNVERALEANITALAREMDDRRLAGLPVKHWHVARMERHHELLRQLSKELTTYNDYANNVITDGQRTMAQLGLNHSATAINATLSEQARIGAFFDVLPIDATEQMVGLAGNGSPLNTLLREAYPTAAQGITDALVRSTALGINPRETARRAVQDGLAQGLNRILTISRTEQLRVYRESSRSNYEKSGIVSSYRRLATKDDRVCAGCLMDDGTVYAVTDIMPEHVQGRCSLIPVVDGVKRVEWQTGPDWFREQPDATQRSILGAGRFDAWKDGKFDLDEVVRVTPNATWGGSIGVRPLNELLSGRFTPSVRGVTAVPVKEAGPPPVEWQPSMSREQAERWVSNSAYKDDVYHVTKGVANERSIAANGFDLSKRNFGRMWGDGVYVGTDDETAELYRSWTGPGARKLTIKTNVENPFRFVISNPQLDDVDIISQALNIPRREAQSMWESRIGSKSEELTRLLSNAGYDALEIVESFESAAGGNQIVIFDPRKVTVISD